jgi:hypothetical protein
MIKLKYANDKTGNSERYGFVTGPSPVINTDGSVTYLAGGNYSTVIDAEGYSTYIGPASSMLQKYEVVEQDNGIILPEFLRTMRKAQ